MRLIVAGLLLTSIARVAFAVDSPGPNAAALYKEYCLACHGEQRVGGTGPALLPESLARIKKDEVLSVVRHGRPASQMVGYAGILPEVQIQALVDHLYQPSETPLSWTTQDTRNSHRVLTESNTLSDQPVHTSDPLNLFVVVEAGNSYVHILDGDSFDIISSFPSHFALHGGPKFSPDGRLVYFASRDGWVSVYDLHNLTMLAETRVALNTRNLAVSSDGRWVLVGNYLPGGLVVLDARDLTLVKEIPASGLDGTASRVSAVYTAPMRDSFIVALKDVPEVWELSYAGKPDFQPRRIQAHDLLDDFSFSPDYTQLLASSRKANGGQVINLDTGNVVSNIPLPGMPHLGSGIYWEYEGRQVFATPNISQGLVSVLDMKTWELVAEIPTEGPGFFMRSHKNSRYAWTDVFFGPNNDAIHLIDKATLKVAHTLRPVPGKNAAHVEFTHDGSHLVLSVWDTDGALIIYEADTLKEVRRIPMNKPSGKYNVGNKIGFAEGTSH